MKKAKGNANTTSLQLNAEEKVALTLWIYKNKDICANMIANDLAIKFTKESGIVVSASSIVTTRNAVFPEMKRSRRVRVSQDDLIARMNHLNQRLLHVEKLLFVKKPQSLI